MQQIGLLRPTAIRSAEIAELYLLTPQDVAHRITLLTSSSQTFHFAPLQFSRCPSWEYIKQMWIFFKYSYTNRETCLCNSVFLDSLEEDQKIQSNRTLDEIATRAILKLVLILHEGSASALLSRMDNTD